MNQFLDLKEQIRNGVEGNRIPAKKVFNFLQELDEKYPGPAVPIEVLLSREKAEKPDALVSALEQIETGVKSGRIPVGEAISAFKDFNSEHQTFID